MPPCRLTYHGVLAFLGRPPDPYRHKGAPLWARRMPDTPTRGLVQVGRDGRPLLGSSCLSSRGLRSDQHSMEAPRTGSARVLRRRQLPRSLPNPFSHQAPVATTASERSHASSPRTWPTTTAAASSAELLPGATDRNGRPGRTGRSVREDPARLLPALRVTTSSQSGVVVHSWEHRRRHGVSCMVL